MNIWTINYIICLLVSILLTGWIIPKILLIAFRRNLFDMPDERKIHTGVVPRLGGIAFMPALLFAFCITIGFSYQLWPCDTIFTMKQGGMCVVFMMCSMTLVYLVGLADDLVGVKYSAKFVVQMVAGVLIIFSGLWVRSFHGFLWIHELPEWFGWIFTIFGIIYVINAVNLIDGIDGLASGLSAVALIWYSYVLWYSGSYAYMLLAGATLGTLVPFFYYNVFGRADHQTKIFMGDTGSLTIGLILAFLAIVVFNTQDTGIGTDYNVFVMAVSPLMLPCFDVVRVFFHRIRKGRSPFLPDKSHIHHKLLALGMYQWQALVLIVATDMLMVLVNVVLSAYISSTLVILIDVVSLIGMNMVLTDLIRKREKRLNKKLYE